MVQWRAAIVFTTLGLLSGCRTDRAITAALPPPTFAPPVIKPSPPPRVAHSKMPAVPHQTARSASPLGPIPDDWVPPAGAPARAWYWIVIHHSATPSGGAKEFAKMHRAKGWDELGYDFVIGNGTDTSDGFIEVGSRWPKQKWGAHAKTPDNRFNEHGIGICLVGNFDIDWPTAAQMRSLAKLVAYLMETYHIPPDRVVGHRDTKATDCPGKHMDLDRVRRMAEADLKAADLKVPVETWAHPLAAH